jgi:predicted outer membrane protein
MEPEKNPNSQYDFIMNVDKKPRLTTGKKTRHLLIIIIVLLIATGGAIAYSMLAGTGKSSTVNLVSLAQKQTEIIRITDIATQKSANPDTKALASTIGYTATSNEIELEKLIKSGGTKLNAQTLAGARDTLADTKLNTAGLNNTFDPIFREVITAKLTDYQSALQEAFTQTSDANVKKFLSSSYDQITLILNSKSSI